MSSFYDDASLVMIPSCYKVSTVLCEKPTDGSGDLTFTRTGDTATRVNSSGLVEKVRTNVLTFSQDFSNASWIVDPLLTRTLNQTDPNGGTTAALYTATSGTNLTFGKNVTLVANAPNTVSIWIKGNASGSVSLRIDDSTLGTQTNINYTTSWQRFSVTRTVNQASCQFVVGGFSTWGTGENLSFAFAQAEAGDIMTAYIPTTTAAVSVGPVANLPRLDYLNSSCPRLLLEPQRTNLLTYSEQFDNASWFKSSASVTANTTTSPSGYNDADTISFNSIATAQVGKAQTFSSATYTISVWVRSSTAKKFRFKVWDGVTDDYTSDYTTTSTWQRFTHTFTKNIINWSIANQSTGGAGDIQVWGCQLEAGSFATSYIPTLAASATRSADACSKTGISSLIGDSEGWIYGEVQGLTNDYGATSTILSVSDGTSSNRVQFSFNSATNTVTPRIFRAGSTIFVDDVFFNASNVFKFAIQYSGSTAVCYINGASVASTSGLTFFSAGTLSKVAFDNGFGSSLGYARISQVLIGQTALTNAQLAELTTL